MAVLMMNVDVYAGTDIREAMGEAVELANIVGIDVKFSFNGVRIYVCPGCGESSIENAIEASCKGSFSDTKDKMIFVK